MKNPLSLKVFATNHSANMFIKSMYDEWDGNWVMSFEEFAAIRYYTDNAYKEINRTLRSTAEKDKLVYPAFINAIRTGITKLNKTSEFMAPKKVYRVVVTKKDSEAFDVRKSFLVDNGFLSTTEDVKSLDVLLDNHLKNEIKSLTEYVNGKEMIIMIIFGWSGGKIESLSFHPREREVLFNPSIKMNILFSHSEEIDKKDKKSGEVVKITTRHIVMEEEEEEDAVKKVNKPTLKLRRKLSL
ncbi:ADP-ribosyltransferase [Serratia marcescens]|uniref:ADP-ribosyltransferase n=1 Tax=Serratia marcescens TaxID=615 RepID=UPI003FA74217